VRDRTYSVDMYGILVKRGKILDVFLWNENDWKRESKHHGTAWIKEVGWRTLYWGFENGGI